MVKLKDTNEVVKEKKHKKDKKEKKRKLAKENVEDEPTPVKKIKVENGENSELNGDVCEKKKKSKKKKEENDAQDTSVAEVNGDLSPKSKKSKKKKQDPDSNEEDEVSDKKSKKKKKSSKSDSENEATENGSVVDKISPEPSPQKSKDDGEIMKKESTLLESSSEKTPEEKKGDFSNFRISQSTIQKLKARNVKYLFPVQSESFDNVYDGKDVIAQARTGTGKTFSFAIPLVEVLQAEGGLNVRRRPPKVLVMAPTRELARQVANDFESISEGLSILSVYGGTPYGPQEQMIRDGVDIIVGTPGRILDFAEKGTLILSQLKHMVLDEVDRMLDMGFADMVDQILQFAYHQENPEQNPQTLFWSATLPDWVFKTAKKYMKNNVEHMDLVGNEPIRTSTTVQHFAIKCSYQDRAETIGNILSVYSGNHGRAMVFCQTKRDADELTMSTAIKQETHVMHGDIPQDKREMVLKSFREGRYKCLITTDVAARGLDIPEVDLVIQCSPPKDTDSYIHRSGRTGRAGRQGICVCFYKPREEHDLQWVETKAGIKFKRIGAPTANDLIEAAANDVIRSLDGISAETLKHFEKSAERLINEKGAKIALSAALAVISGNTEIKSRSLLNSFEGFTTYVFRTTVNMNSKGYCWNAIDRCLPTEVREKIKGMRFCADKMGCVFDVPSELDSVITDRWSDGKFDTLEVATELPELLEDEYSNRFSNSGSGNRNWGGGSGGWGGGNRGRGGFGRGGGRGRGFDNRGRGFRGGGGFSQNNRKSF